MENPWNVQSLKEFQFFNCPSCVFKNHSKQEFINHAYEDHSEFVYNLKNINDDSFVDVICPWNEPISQIKIEELTDIDESIKTEEIDPLGIDNEKTEKNIENVKTVHKETKIKIEVPDSLGESQTLNQTNIKIKNIDPLEIDSFKPNSKQAEEKNDFLPLNNTVQNKFYEELNNTEKQHSSETLQILQESLGKSGNYGRTIKCDFCFETFRSSNKNNHINNFHQDIISIVEQGYKCAICNKVMKPNKL